MGTINSVGTMFYGWQHEDHSTARVTEWFVVAFFPVFPLGRYRIHLEPESTSKGAFGFGYQVLEKLPISLSSIITTLYKAYLIVPALFALPIIFLLSFHNLIAVAGPHRDTFEAIETIGFVLTFFYYPVVVCLILDRAAGRSRPPAGDPGANIVATTQDGDFSHPPGPVPTGGSPSQSSEHLAI